MQTANKEEMDVLGDKIRVLITGKESGGTYEIMVFTSTKGSGPPPHSHAWTEATYVLEGEMEFIQGGRSVPLSSGDLIHIPPNEIHTYNILSAEARYLVVTNPSGVYPFLVELGARTAGHPDDVRTILDVSAKYGVFVPA